MFKAIRRFFGFDPADEDDLTTDGVASSPPPPVHAFRIGEKLSIKGEILGEGDLDLAGRFEGVINLNGRVVVGDRAEVDADITASTIVVGGKVRGNLNAVGRVEILPQGVLTGNLKSGSFTAADGALVKGEITVERGTRGRVEGGGSGMKGALGALVLLVLLAGGVQAADSPATTRSGDSTGEAAVPAADTGPETRPGAPAAGVSGTAARDGGAGVPRDAARLAARRFELVVGESTLYRDAFSAAARVGRVVRGELLTYVDFVDRRLRILNALVFDGGYWIKVRATDGREGWLPADLLREVR